MGFERTGRAGECGACENVCVGRVGVWGVPVDGCLRVVLRNAPATRLPRDLSLMSRLPPASRFPSPRRAHPGGWRPTEKRHRALPRCRLRPLAKTSGVPPTRGPLTHLVRREENAGAAAGKGSARRPPPPRPGPGRRLKTGGLLRLPLGGRQVRAGGPAPAPRPAPPSPGTQVRQAAAAGRTRAATAAPAGAPERRELVGGRGPSAAGPPAGCCRRSAQASRAERAFNHASSPSAPQGKCRF